MKKQIKVVTLILVMLLATGCGSSNYVVDSKDKIVTDPTTGQNLQRDLLCKPSEDTEIYELYEKYEKQMVKDLDELPECDEFKMNSTKTNSLWQFLFVKPLAYLILQLGNVFHSWGMTKAYLGLSLMVVGILIRLIILPFNIKAQNQSRKMQEALPQIQKIEKKYANRTDQESMILKSQEMMSIYKKYKVNPMLSCLLSLIQLPIFFAFLQAIYKIPAIYEGEMFGLKLGVTPSVGIFDHQNYFYIILVVLIILTTYFSFKYTMKQSQSMTGNTNAGNQMNTMLIIMTALISIASFTLPTALALYWIVTYAFIIAQTFIMNLIHKRKDNKKMKSTKKNIKDKLNLKEGMKYGKTK